jgi:cell division protein ZapD
MDRGDLKNDLMHDLEKHRALLAFFRSNPKIDKAKLNDTLDLVNAQLDQLKSVPPKPVQELKQNDWLMAIKQRGIIPGGLCEFDAPSYHFWLSQPDGKRRDDLQSWLSHIMPVYESLELMLSLLRGSGESESLIAENGSFQQMLGTSKPAQMVRIEVNNALSCYPEISANKYAIHIRFMRINDQRQASACQQEVHFKLTLASL